MHLSKAAMELRRAEMQTFMDMGAKVIILLSLQGEERSGCS